MPSVFLNEQPIFRITERDPDRRWQAVLCEGEPRDDLRGDSFPFAIRSPDQDQQQSVWKRVNRTKFHTKIITRPHSFSRVALICGAGLGKTTSLQSIEHAINSSDSRNLAVYLELGHLKKDLDELFGMIIDRYKHLKGVRHSRLLLDSLPQFRNEGRITLLFDSLDQAGADPDGPIIRLFSRLLESDWAACPIWITGRPAAFQPNHAIFKDHEQYPWKFFRIGQLDEAEKRFHLDAVHCKTHKQSFQICHLYDDLPAAAQKLSGVPRYANLIARLTGQTLKEKLAKDATAADVYWLIYTLKSENENDCGILQDGLKANAAKWLAYRGERTSHAKPDRAHQIRRACDLLGAIAFDMLVPRDEHGQLKKPEWNGVERDFEEQFKKSVRDRFLKSGAFKTVGGKDEKDDDFEADWESILAMDSAGLGHLIWSNHGSQQSLRWADITTMAFFAAYWACHWASDEDLKTIRTLIIDPIAGTNDEFREFWEFVIDLPEKGKRWEDVVGLLYELPLIDKPVIRSTEFIFRSWKRIEETEKGKAKKKAFLQEFKDIASGGSGQAKQALAGSIHSGMQRVEAGNCPYGSKSLTDPGTQRHCDRFQMHMHQVTNEVYELFDQNHHKYRWSGWNHDDVQPHPLGDDSKCPVVNVTWYDAQVFAWWCGCDLPTELQWEHALRRGKPGKFHFGDRDDDLENYAWYARNSESSTHPVGGLRKNENNLFDMHGNVWEWSKNWFDSEHMYKSLRGGSWDFNPVNLAAAYRVRLELSDRYHHWGFRLVSAWTDL